MHPSTRHLNRSLYTIKHQDKILSTGPNPMVYSLKLTVLDFGAQKNKPDPQWFIL